jgi:hypothetical protein
MQENLIVLPEEVAYIAQSVSDEKRNEVQAVLNHVFNGVSKMREQLESVVVADENDKINMKLANAIRLGVKQVRLEAEKTFDAKRAEVQAQMISFKTEDQLWLKSKQTMQILAKEIEEQARWKEETKQRFDAEQKELQTQQRILQVSKFAPEIQRSEFENMTDEGFRMFLSGIEKTYNDKIEAEKIANEERIAKEKAEAEERERIRLENERFKAEVEERERVIAEEKKKLEAERKAIEEKAKKEKAELLEKAKKEKAVADAKLKAVQLELKAKEDAEKAKLLAEKKAKSAPDKIKLEHFVKFIQDIQYPELKSDEGKKIITDVRVLMSKVASFINDKSSEL